LELTLLATPSSDDRRRIEDALIGYNKAVAPTDASCLAVVLRDGDQTVGGLWGTCLYDWLTIELVIVPEAQRRCGLGTMLLERAELEARRRGCVGAWLDTFSFQARGFYERAGYSLAGEIPDHPISGARYFLSKRFS
jgi:GNAT superfamily N-acetyltransferase